MPLYEYRCKNCNSKFEKMVRFGENSQSQECPRCHSHETQKQISTFATQGSAASISGSCSSTGRFT